VIEKFFFDGSFFSQETTAFLKTPVFGHTNFQWLFLLAALLLGMALRPLVQPAFKLLKKHNPLVKRRPDSFVAHFSAAPLERPIAWIFITALWIFALQGVRLSGQVALTLHHLLNAFFAYQVVKLVYYAVESIGKVMANYTKKTESLMDDQLVPFVTKSLKVLVVILGVLIVLQNFGLNVMSLLAGLGLGGLALALAAQDTAANVFGSITILLDRPFKVGDWVKIKDIEGTVEDIGFRSTRIRTFYNSQVTIPNSVMAKENIDNMGARPARRVRQILGLAYETPPARIEEFCSRVRFLITQNHIVVPESVIVSFTGFADSSLNILVNCNIQVSLGTEELAFQQNIYLEILKIAAEMKVDFAYPTRTVYQKTLQ